MKKQFLFVASLFLLLIITACQAIDVETGMDQANEPREESTPDAAFPRTVTDGRGKEITLEQKPQKIVSTALAIDEFLLSLVDTDQIMAITELATDEGISNVADQAKSFENKIQTLTAEQVIALQPDLVILATYAKTDVVEQLENLGITTYQLQDQQSIEGILNSIEQLGELLGEEERAENLIKNIQQRLNEIEQKLAAIKETEKPRVLYWTSYGSSVTGNTTIGDMIKKAGGMNVIEEAGIKGEEYEDYPNISKEKVVELNPDVIITSAWLWDKNEEGYIERWKNDPALQKVNAIKNDQVFAIHGAHITTASHYVIEGVEDIFNKLYPELK